MKPIVVVFFYLFFLNVNFKDAWNFIKWIYVKKNIYSAKQIDNLTLNWKSSTWWKNKKTEELRIIKNCLHIISTLFFVYVCTLYMHKWLFNCLYIIFILVYYIVIIIIIVCIFFFFFRIFKKLYIEWLLNARSHDSYVRFIKYKKCISYISYT